VQISRWGPIVETSAGTVRDEFDARTWTAFWRPAVEGDRPADVAADLHVSVWAVYKSRARMLQRLRSELDGLQ
jgi:RNA polymerase sigma-70 factor (ECF subfamily)